MIFDISGSSRPKLEKFYKDAMKRLSKFYDIKPGSYKPSVFLLKNRKDIDQVKGKKTEDWVVGFATESDKLLFLLDPDFYEQESSHTYSDREYSTLLAHELSHLFAKKLFRGYKPVWLSEGTALYSSGQLESRKVPKEFKKFLQYFDSGGAGVYGEAGFAVEIMIKAQGKEKFLEFYKAQEDVETKDDLKKVFKKFYKEDLTYKFFNSRL